MSSVACCVMRLASSPVLGASAASLRVHYCPCACCVCCVYVLYGRCHLLWCCEHIVFLRVCACVLRPMFVRACLLLRVARARVRRVRRGVRMI